jgi:Family of unknown function (DUF6644)
MSVQASAIKLERKVSSTVFLRTRIVGLVAGVIVSILVSASVWFLARVIPSKTDSPFAPIREICRWIYQSSVSVGIRESTLLFPAIEGIHLLGIALSVGLLCWFDLRLMGVVMTHEPISKVWKRVMPSAFTGFVLMFITGGLLFWAEAATAYDSTHFWIKMALILLAGINAGYFELSTHKHMSEWDNEVVPPMRARLAGLTSLVLWTAVIVTGRTMAYAF